MDYLTLAHDAVRQAQAAGVAAEAIIGVGDETEIQVNNGQVERLTQAGIKILGVRIIQDGKMGYAYTSDFTPESLTQTVRGAIALAAVATPDSYRSLPELQPVNNDDLEINDATIATTTIEEKIISAQEMESATRAVDHRVKVTDRAVYQDIALRIHLVNTNGFAGSYAKTMVWGYLRAVAIDGNERAWAHGGRGATFRSELDLRQLGAEVGETAAHLLNARSVPTQETTVVYSPVAAADFLAVVARAVTAEAMQRKRSFLEGKLGRNIASNIVTLLDNGRLRRSIASRPFDDEGVPTSTTCLINEGVLQALLYDTYTARKDGVTSTGNAQSNFHTPPGVSISNFYLQPGQQRPAALIAGVQRGLYVVDAVSSGATNPVSGDYSVAARGFWIENGELTFPVHEVTIALSLGQLLQNVTAVGDDLEFRYGSIGSPTLRIDGVMVGGSQ